MACMTHRSSFIKPSSQTPRPSSTRLTTSCEIIPSPQNDGERVATVFRDEANAALIAAAPDLLEACKQAADWIERGREEKMVPSFKGVRVLAECVRLVDQLHAAITKAEATS